MTSHFLTIDLEDQYAAPVLQVRGRDFESKTEILEKQLDETLAFLDEINVKATFFTVASMTEKIPDLTKKILEKEHEIACHGDEHKVLCNHSPESFKKMLIKSREKLGDIKGYRAPMFTLNQKTSWALDILQETGFKYDSSIFPCWSPEYGVYTAPTQPYHINSNKITKPADSGLMEFPLLTYNLGPLRIPAAGGFYMRKLPFFLIRNAVKSRDKKNNSSTIYAHSWEIAPDLSQKKDNGWYCNTILYSGLEKTKKYIQKLSQEFKFQTIKSTL